MNLKSSADVDKQSQAENDDLSLILRMVCKDSNREDAEAALTKFFERYHKIVKAFAERNNFRSLGFDVDDFVLKTFHKAYERIETFSAETGLSTAQLEQKIKTWLFQIAKNEFLMEFRKSLNKHEETTDQDFELSDNDKDVDLDGPIDPPLKGKAAAVRTFLEKLPEGDRLLLETSMNFYDFMSQKCIIPKELLLGLAHALSTTPEGIKQKRKRLLRKLEEHLTSS
jgi:RNA polymerase sigma factor (sigma-70 family)